MTMFFDYRPENPPEGEPIGKCDLCGGDIYDGDDVYRDYDEGLICYECYEKIEDRRREEAHRVAGEIGWEA